jgi:ribosomal protein S18 acetylase RimI-like enzyme
MLGCAIEWLQTAGVQSTWVNTEPDNAAALSLYARAGFRRQPAGLVVVEWIAP